MARFLLIGPRGGGKTEILRSVTRKDISEECGATIERRIEHIGGVLWGALGSDRFEEIPGNTKCINEMKDSLEGCKNDDFVMYVFDGQSFMQQIKHPEEGGEIYGRWLFLKPYCKNLKHVHFIATHADKVPDMKNEINKLIRQANEKYQTLIHKDRYDISLFEDAFFHCIDARHDTEGPLQIKKIIDELKS